MGACSRFRTRTTSVTHTVLRPHTSTTAQMSFRTYTKSSVRSSRERQGGMRTASSLLRSVSRTSLYIVPLIRLTPPRRARRRISPFVTPWMLSRKIFLYPSASAFMCFQRGRSNVPVPPRGLHPLSLCRLGRFSLCLQCYCHWRRRANSALRNLAILAGRWWSSMF